MRPPSFRPFPSSLFVSAACSVFLGLVFLGFSGSALAEPIATVNGQPVKGESIARAIDLVNSRLKNGKTMTPKQRKKLKSRLAKEMVAEALVNERIAREKLKASKKALDRALMRKRAAFNHEKGFQAFLAATGQSEDNLRESLRHQVLRERLVSRLLKTKPPTLADAKKALSEDPDRFVLPESADLRQILLVKPAGASAEALKKFQSQARSVYKQVSRQPKLFSDVAAVRSEGPAKRGGGRLGKIRRGRMGRLFDRVVFSADPGTVVGPIETPTAFHIVYIVARFPEEPLNFVQPTSVAFDALYADYEARTWGPLMGKLFREGKVVILDDEIELSATEMARPRRSARRLPQKGKRGDHAHGGHGKAGHGKAGQGKGKGRQQAPGGRAPRRAPPKKSR